MSPRDSKADMPPTDAPTLGPYPSAETDMTPTLVAPTREVPRDFRFVDLFAGIGGLRLGLEGAGGRCVYSVEIDRHAQITYAANFGPIDEADVRALDPTNLPPYDVLAAGFPCQPFSIAGVSKKVSLGRPHGFEDKTSGNLFFEIVRIAAATRPPILFLENVKNLRSHDHGNTFAVILGELDRLGYEVANDVVDAASWVPQHRERTFMIGLRREIFGDRKVPISSIKSMLGHCMGASSAIEAIACVMTLESGIYPPTIGYETPDPECDLDVVANYARRGKSDVVLNNSLAFGGYNAVTCFARPGRLPPPMSMHVGRG